VERLCLALLKKRKNSLTDAALPDVPLDVTRCYAAPPKRQNPIGSAPAGKFRSKRGGVVPGRFR
jgi:hypothetical protein